MKRMRQTSHVTELFVRAGLVAALAAVLLAPMTIRADGGEGLQQGASPVLKASSWNALPLPPIPHLETMPWLVRERAQKGFRIDTLLAPNFAVMGPAVAGRAARPLDASRNG